MRWLVGAAVEVLGLGPLLAGLGGSGVAVLLGEGEDGATAHAWWGSPFWCQLPGRRSTRARSLASGSLPCTSIMHSMMP